MDMTIRARLSLMMFLQYFVWGAWFVPFATYLTHNGLQDSVGTIYSAQGWAVLEWECAYKHPEQGAAEGAPFIARHMIRKVEHAFDDFAGAAPDAAKNRRVLGLIGA